MGILRSIGQFIEGLVTLAFASGIGAIAGGIVGAISGGEKEIGSFAIAGAIVGAVARIIVVSRRAARLRIASARGQGDIGSIVAISSEPPPGAAWTEHAYVLFDVGGKRRKLRLPPGRAQDFVDRFAVGDVGRVIASGKALADFLPPSAAAPLRSKTGLRVFVSYAHGQDPEGQMAEYVAEVLAGSGLDPWLDRKALQPGQKLRAELVERIRQSDFFVPLLSRPYVTSDWCLQEFEAAAEAGVAMRPIKITAETLVLPPYLKDLYDRVAGEPVYLDMQSRHAPARLREMAEEMARTGRSRPG